MKEERIGVITMTNKQIAQLMNLSPQTIARYYKELEKAEIMTIIRTQEEADYYGWPIGSKVFFLNKIYE